MLPNTPKKVHNTNKHCPLHKKLRTLRSVVPSEKSHWTKRKSLLKNNGICFRCCISTCHFARDCKTVLRCADCGSKRRGTAPHPGCAAMGLLSLSTVRKAPHETRIHHLRCRLSAQKRAVKATAASPALRSVWSKRVIQVSHRRLQKYAPS